MDESNNENKKPLPLEVFRKMFLHKLLKDNDILDIDLEKELELIKEKRSNLSRRQRDAIKTAMALAPLIERAYKEKIQEQEIQEADITTVEPATTEKPEASSEQQDQPKEEEQPVETIAEA